MKIKGPDYRNHRQPIECRARAAADLRLEALRKVFERFGERTGEKYSAKPERAPAGVAAERQSTPVAGKQSTASEQGEAAAFGGADGDGEDVGAATTRRPPSFLPSQVRPERVRTIWPPS